MAPAAGGTNSQPNARLLAIVAPMSASGATCALPEFPCRGSGGASDLVSRPASSQPEDVFIYVVAAGTDDLNAGLAGAQFGIEYDKALQSGIDISSWTWCSVAEYPTASWPQSGSGNTVAWLRDRLPEYPCPRVSQMVIGYFTATVHGEDRLTIVPHPATGIAKVADCRAAETWLDDSALGAAGVGGAAGDDPCGRPILEPLPVPGGGAESRPAWEGARLLMHAVPSREATRDACRYNAVSSCTNRAGGGRVSLPDPGGSPVEYMVYVILHDPDYAITTVLHLAIGRLAMEGVDVLDWTQCAPGTRLTSTGWPGPGTSMVLPRPELGKRVPDTLIGAFRVLVKGPGYLKFGQESTVDLPGPGIDTERKRLRYTNQLGWIGIGNIVGNYPCPARHDYLDGGFKSPPPATTAATVVPMTWGRIKTLVR